MGDFSAQNLFTALIRIHDQSKKGNVTFGGSEIYNKFDEQGIVKENDSSIGFITSLDSKKY